MAGPRFFETPEAFRAWLEDYHASADELVVGFWKKGTGRASMTWPESVDEALCFGWIDGVRKRLDDEAYTIRFTPRRPRSHWSKRNLARVAALTEAGRMRPAGLAAHEARDPARQGEAAHEQDRAPTLGAAFEKRLRANEVAWAWWQKQTPSYRRTVAHWVTSAKKEETRERRFEQLVASCEEGKPVPPMRYGKR